MMNGIQAKTGPEVKTLQGILPERDSGVDEDWRRVAEWRGVAVNFFLLAKPGPLLLYWPGDFTSHPFSAGAVCRRGASGCRSAG